MKDALSGIKVLDFSTLLPGPYGSMLLQGMGAQVTRVEAPSRPDLVRALKPEDASGHSAAHSYLNRGKHSIAIDLKHEQAQSVVRDLVRQSDVVIEQFRPGVMDRLGLGYETLSQWNPKLIFCSITGYGQDGPFKDRAGHDINYLALSGIADYSRRRGQAPVPFGVQVADVAGGAHHAVMAILAAIIKRQRTQTGEHLDISMTDCAVSMNAMFGAALLANEEVGAETNVLNGGAFYDYYETRDARYMSVGSLEPQFFQVLCKTLNMLDVIHLAGSQKHEDRLQFKERMKQAFLTETFEVWRERFAGLDCCVEPVLTLREALDSELSGARNWVAEVPCSETEGSVKQLNHPISKSVGQATTGGRIGADTDSVLLALGYDQARIDQLKQGKAVK